MSELITIDGAFGEGGGQVLRSALSLSAVTGRPFRIHGIRAGRRRPGLMRQHLTAVKAAATVCGAAVDGADVGSREITFRPDGGGVRGGEYSFAIGTAGSTNLVLQTVMPPLLCAKKPSVVEVSGGTHNPMAPPFEFLQRSFGQQARRCGYRFDLKLLRAGFAPAGGGLVRAEIRPRASGVDAEQEPFELIERGKLLSRRATAQVANLGSSIAERELDVARKKLGFAGDELRVDGIANCVGQGNVFRVEFEYENVTEILTGFGRIGYPAERVARDVVRDARRYLGNSAPVGEHLADQLLLPIALAGGGRFRTLKPTMHTRTNCDVIELFLPVRFEREELADGVWEIRCAVS